jgi:endonuclease/exonuclease/phosphatase family metal-dependent hydrolase
MKRVDWAIVSGAMLALLSPPSAKAAKPGSTASVSVMTYNVNGLPWPLARGREAAFRGIESRLRKMRTTGTQPHIIVLQEAFTTPAKNIATNSGYRFIANGPSAALGSAIRPTAADRAFSEGASSFKGEKSGKYLDSGLQIASDYPIISIRRAAFPSFACAGYDCLANKGVLLVTVKLPDNPVPVTIATTHLNSKRSSGVSQLRSLYAYRRQIDVINGFLAAHRDPRQPIIFAGDFNATNVQRRTYLFGRGTASWSADARLSVESALDRCLNATPPCLGRAPPIATYIRARARDWQFYIPGLRGSIAAVGLAVPFGRERSGEMLSDHVGYGITYRLWQSDAASDSLFR